MHTTVIVDAFRAFATASYVLEWEPASYVLTTKSSILVDLTREVANPFFIGKPEKEGFLSYDIPNSPTRVMETDLRGRHVFHRTAAGAKGILDAKGADFIFGCAFTNAKATTRKIQQLSDTILTIVPMGHEGETPSLEDSLCTQYVEGLLNGETLDLAPFIPALKDGPGHYFFSEDQWQYPRDDFDRCMELDRVNFSIQADVKNGYAILWKC